MQSKHFFPDMPKLVLNIYTLPAHNIPVQHISVPMSQCKVPDLPMFLLIVQASPYVPWQHISRRRYHLNCAPDHNHPARNNHLLPHRPCVFPEFPCPFSPLRYKTSANLRYLHPPIRVPLQFVKLPSVSPLH